MVLKNRIFICKKKISEVELETEMEFKENGRN